MPCLDERGGRAGAQRSQRPRPRSLENGSDDDLPRPRAGVRRRRRVARVGGQPRFRRRAEPARARRRARGYLCFVNPDVVMPAERRRLRHAAPGMRRPRRRRRRARCSSARRRRRSGGTTASCTGMRARISNGAGEAYWRAAPRPRRRRLGVGRLHDDRPRRVRGGRRLRRALLPLQGGGGPLPADPPGRTVACATSPSVRVSHGRRPCVAERRPEHFRPSIDHTFGRTSRAGGAGARCASSISAGRAADDAMRVAVVAEYYPRAADPVLGVWAHRQALAARDAGADVRVLVLHRPIPPLSAPPRDLPRADAAPLRQPRHASSTGSRSSTSRSSRRRARGRYAVVGRVGGAVARARAAPPARRFPFDLVHAHYAVPAGDAVRARAGRRAARRLGARRRRVLRRAVVRARPRRGPARVRARAARARQQRRASRRAHAALGARRHARRAPRHRPAAAGAPPIRPAASRRCS